MVSNLPADERQRSFWEPVAFLTTQLDDTLPVAFSVDERKIHFLRTYPGGSQGLVEWAFDAADLDHYLSDPPSRGVYLQHWGALLRDALQTEAALTQLAAPARLVGYTKGVS